MTLAGDHEVRIHLNGSPIQRSPVFFTVLPEENVIEMPVSPTNSDYEN